MASDNLAIRILISARDTASSVLVGVRRVLGDVRTQVSALVASFEVLRAAQEGVGNAAGMEDLRLQFKGLLGSEEEARAKLDELNAAFGLRQVEAAQQLFASLMAFGLKPTVEQLKALIDYNARTGKGAENLNGIVDQLGQAWGKEKLQYEDILILLERGVPVWELLAKASGKTTTELAAMATNGQLGRTAITALIAEMGKVADGASAARLQTWNGLWEATLALWRRFSSDIMSGGVFDYLKSKLQEVSDVLEYAIQSGAARRWGEAFGEAVTSAGAWAEQMTRYVSNLVGAIQVVVNAAAGAINGIIAVVTGSLSGLADLVSRLPKLFWQAYPELKSGLDAWRADLETSYQGAVDRSRQSITDLQAGWGKINEAAAKSDPSQSWAGMVEQARAFNAEAERSRQGAKAVADELRRAKGEAGGLASAMGKGGGGTPAAGAGAGGGSGAPKAGGGGAGWTGGGDFSGYEAEQLTRYRARLNDLRAAMLAQFREGKLTAQELAQANVDLGRQEALSRGSTDAAREQKKADQERALNGMVPTTDALVQRVRFEIDPEGKAQVDAFAKSLQAPLTVPVAVKWTYDAAGVPQTATGPGYEIARGGEGPTKGANNQYLQWADEAATTGRQP